MMNPKYLLLLLFYIVAVTARAQNRQSDSLKIGDPAPPFRVQSWIKGTPVQSLEKCQVYVVGFWATWCRPCVASMSHVSGLAHKYQNKVTFLAIAVWEEGLEYHPTVSPKRIKTFVDSMGYRMDFPVAVDDSNFMANHWVRSSNENSIPSDFVINAEGRVAWIGNPADLDGVLPQIIDHTWDIKVASAKRISDERLKELDFKTEYKLHRYLSVDDSFNYHFVKPDSALLAINEIVKKKPGLKYAPNIAYWTFWALLKTNPHKAYEYGKKVIATSTYQEPAYNSIINIIEDSSLGLKIHPEIYRLEAEAYQSEIDSTNPIYRKLLDLPNIYRKMASCYRLAGDSSKAVEAGKKAKESEDLKKIREKL